MKSGTTKPETITKITLAKKKKWANQRKVLLSQSTHMEIQKMIVGKTEQNKTKGIRLSI